MHTMQYEFTLPAGHDMGTIRRRVADKGPLTDDFPGLAYKAFLIRERGVDGSPVNQYAPSYLWRTGDGMAAFLTGPGFRTLCADFGRPAVRHRPALGFRPGPAVGLAPRAALRTTTALSEDADLTALPDGSEFADGPGLHSTTLSLDTERWELVRLSLWHGDAPDLPGVRYQVLHLSRPELSLVRDRDRDRDRH
ncbi:DUF4865 family protein [Kitasatospora sp. NPDC054939]